MIRPKIRMHGKYEWLMPISKTIIAAMASGVIEKLFDKANAAVADIRYYTGFHKAVWKQFAWNFLATEGEKDR
jgi:hypothetical protein